MPIAAWPETVEHHIVRGSFRLVAPSRPRFRSEYEDGPNRARRSSTKNIATVAFDLSLLPDEFQAFVAWVRDALIEGTLPFTMPVLLAGGGVYGTRTCFFAEDLTYRAQSSRGPYTTVTLVLDVEEWGAPTEEDEPEEEP